MDYLKPAIFGENWSPSRYKVLPYFGPEKEIVIHPRTQKILDLGCANGWNMSRFSQYGKAAVGIDVEMNRLKLARQNGDVAFASGLRLPFPDQSFDLIYIQHVLHHIDDVPAALREVHRCLKPTGWLFLVETVEDNPLIHLGRTVQPSWRGDAITARFRYDQLTQQLQDAGFSVSIREQYSVLFWAWEILPDRWSQLEKLTPFFVTLELGLQQFLNRFSAHAFWAAQPMSASRP